MQLRPLPSTGRLSLLAAGCGLALGVSHAAAQSPSVNCRVVVTSSAPGHPANLPNNEGLSALHRFGPGMAIVETSSRTVYVADGASFRQVMPLGQQIPGQPAGVVWASRLGSAQTFDITGRGQLFFALATGPGIGQSPREVPLLGDLLGGGDLWIGAPNQSFSAVTRSALYPVQGSSPQLAIGHVETGPETLVPAGATIPGFSEPIGAWVSSIVNADGQVIGVARVGADGPYVLCTVINGAITPIGLRGTIFNTDRGALTADSSPQPACQVLADGSAVLSGFLLFPDGARRLAIFSRNPDGSCAIIAVDGEHAPGTPRELSLTSPSVLVAERGGKLLWTSRLSRDGAAVGTAIYLWSNGRSRLILRTGVTSPGNPDGLGVPNLDQLVVGPGVVQLNARGDVALSTSSPGPDPAIYLYNAQAGTVEAARRGRLLPESSGLTWTASVLGSMFGSSSGAWRTAGDDTGIPQMDENGDLFTVGIVTSSPFSSNFAAFLSIASPGCRPDYTQDGFLDFFDYIAFLDCFEGGACPMGKDADFNNDDFADFFDYSDFIDAFETGC